MHHRTTLEILEAEMDVDAAPRAVRLEDRREDRPMAEAECTRTRHFAQLHGVVGRLHPETRRDSHLVLPLGVFG